MKRILATLVLATLLASFAAEPTAAQIGSPASISLIRATIDATHVLDEDGQLPRSTHLQNKYEFEIQLPPVTGICPTGTLHVSYSVVKKPDYATAYVSPSSQFASMPLPNPLGPTTIGGFLTGLNIIHDARAPHHQASEYMIKVEATPSHGATGGCFVGPSHPLLVTYTVVSA